MGKRAGDRRPSRTAKPARQPNGLLPFAISLACHLLILGLIPFPQHAQAIKTLEIVINKPEPEPPPPVEEPKPEPETKPEIQPKPEPQPEPVPSPAPPEPLTEPVGVVESTAANDSAPVTVPVPVRPGPVQPQPNQPKPELPAPAPEPAPQPEPAVDVKALLTEYAAGIKAQILARKYYPGIAERLGHEGDVIVGFTVTASGQLEGVRIKSGSGWDELDEAALDAVRSAEPFAGIPAEAERESLSLSITLKYRLS